MPGDDKEETLPHFENDPTIATYMFRLIWNVAI